MSAQDERQAESGNSAKLRLADTHYGQMLVFEKDRIIGDALVSSGSFQEEAILEVVKFIESVFSKTPAVFVDIGANIGTHVIHAVKRSGFRQGIAFEPDPENFRLLRANALINGVDRKIEFHNLAVTERSAELDLGLSDYNYGDHRVVTESAKPGSRCRFESQRECIKIRGVSLDELFPCKEEGDWSDCLFWIDTQGHEGHIFDGGRALFSPRSHKKFVVAEFWPYGLELAGGKESFFRFARNCSRIYDIKASGWMYLPPTDPDALHGMYEKMLAETRADYYPHTDLLFVV